MAPNMAMPTKNPSVDPTVKIELWKRRFGRIGSGARLSCRTKSPAATAATTSKPMIVLEPHA